MYLVFAQKWHLTVRQISHNKMQMFMNWVVHYYTCKHCDSDLKDTYETMSFYSFSNTKTNKFVFPLHKSNKHDVHIAHFAPSRGYTTHICDARQFCPL